MSTFITRLDSGGTGLRLAVKDLIDMVGLTTTGGCRALADAAAPAETDAACMVGTRAAEASGAVRIVGKTNLHELAFGVTGINPWFGTPVNPLDPTLVPGGSSSGSAVAVAGDEADIAFGTDTGGSIRIPAACCGIAGLKTTWGRIPLDGVLALAPSLDTVGPMARDVAGVVQGMALLEPGFEVPDTLPRVIGRVRFDASPSIDAAIDAALHAAGFTVEDVELPGWDVADERAMQLMRAEAWDVRGALITAHPEGVGADVAGRVLLGRDVTSTERDRARRAQAAWQAELAALFERVQLLAMPMLTDVTPTLDDAERIYAIRRTLPINLAGVPALAMPVGPGPRRASLQLVGPLGSEDLLLAAGLAIEAATT